MSGRDRIRDLERAMAISRAVSAGDWAGGPPIGHLPLFGGGRGRRRRGDVRQSILLLLAEQPRNGYQLMQSIEERSRGRWRPSPGSVYPTLAQLEDEGLIRATLQEGSKLFEITDRGREQLGQHPHGGAPWADDEDAGADACDQLRTLTHSLHLAVSQVAQAGDEQQIAQAARALSDTRRRLYRILAEDGTGIGSEPDD